MRSRGRPIILRTPWARALRGRSRAAIEARLPGFLLAQRWFGGKGRRIRHATVVDAVPLPAGRDVVFVTLVGVSYAEGRPDTHTLVLGCVLGDEASRMRHDEPHRVVADVTLGEREGVVHEALGDPGPSAVLLRAIARRSVLEGSRGSLVGVPGPAFRRMRGTGPLDSRLLGAEQSNTSVVFGRRLILKIFRRAEPGANPELEIGRFLTDRARFAHAPAVAGGLEYRPRRGGLVTLGVLQACVPNRGDAWTHTLAALRRYYGRLVSTPSGAGTRVRPAGSARDQAQAPIHGHARRLVGSYLDDARLLGRRTGELHLALAHESTDPAFAPEAFTPSYRHSLGRSMCSLAERNLSLLKRRLPALSPETQAAATALVKRRGELLGRCQAVATRKVTALRTRVHGDYHLGQVLRTSDDFVIIDFEGEPAVPLSARCLKHSPLKDVAGMVRSFHYAAHHSLRSLEARETLRPEVRAALTPWARCWCEWVTTAFLDEYLVTVNGATFLPPRRDDVDALLAVYLLEKAIYELGYELNNRPEWVHLPLGGIHELLAANQGDHDAQVTTETEERQT